MNKMETINIYYYPYVVRKWYPGPDNGIKVIVEEHYFDNPDKAEEELRRCKKTIRQYKGKWHPHYKCALEIYKNPIILSGKER